MHSILRSRFFEPFSNLTSGAADSVVGGFGDSHCSMFTLVDFARRRRHNAAAQRMLLREELCARCVLTKTTVVEAEALARLLIVLVAHEHFSTAAAATLLSSARTHRVLTGEVPLLALREKLRIVQSADVALSAIHADFLSRTQEVVTAHAMLRRSLSSWWLRRQSQNHRRRAGHERQMLRQCETLHAVVHGAWTRMHLRKSARLHLAVFRDAIAGKRSLAQQYMDDLVDRVQELFALCIAAPIRHEAHQQRLALVGVAIDRSAVDSKWAIVLDAEAKQLDMKAVACLALHGCFLDCLGDDAALSLEAIRETRERSQIVAAWKHWAQIVGNFERVAAATQIASWWRWRLGQIRRSSIRKIQRSLRGGFCRRCLAVARVEHAERCQRADLSVILLESLRRSCAVESFATSTLITRSDAGHQQLRIATITLRAALADAMAAAFTQDCATWLVTELSDRLSSMKEGLSRSAAGTIGRIAAAFRARSALGRTKWCLRSEARRRESAVREVRNQVVHCAAECIMSLRTAEWQRFAEVVHPESIARVHLEATMIITPMRAASTLARCASAALVRSRLRARRDVVVAERAERNVRFWQCDSIERETIARERIIDLAQIGLWSLAAKQRQSRHLVEADVIGRVRLVEQSARREIHEGYDRWVFACGMEAQVLSSAARLRWSVAPAPAPSRTVHDLSSDEEASRQLIAHDERGSRAEATLLCAHNAGMVQLLESRPSDFGFCNLLLEKDMLEAMAAGTNEEYSDAPPAEDHDDHSRSEARSPATVEDLGNTQRPQPGAAIPRNGGRGLLESFRTATTSDDDSDGDSLQYADVTWV